MVVASNLDLLKNALQNALAHPNAGAPSSPSAGQIYYETSTNKFMFYNGSAWIDSTARANHTGTQLASTISDFDTQVRTSRLDQMSAPTAAVAMNAQKITGLADPTNPQDAATKAYCDAAAAGIDAKASVRAATTANITLSGTQTIDGVSVVAGNRVLVKNQSTASQNGIYDCAAGAWTRSIDCDSSAEYTPQAFVYVEEGTTNANTQWKVSTTGTITVGTTSVTWSQFGAAGAYTGGNGLTLSGNDFAVGAGTGISVGADTVSIDTAVVVRKYNTTVGDGSTQNIVVTHNLGTRDVQVQVYRVASPYDQILVDNERTTTNTVTLKFTTAPAAGAYAVTVQG